MASTVGDKMTGKDRIYLPEIVRGLAVTASHLLANLRSPARLLTWAYPEVQKPLSPRLRSRHRLVVDGRRERCVACCCCATACPAGCIEVRAAEGGQGKEKAPDVFEIDLLRCVFCGLCVEACPRDAIRMDTNEIALAGCDRGGFVLGRDELAAAGAAG